MNAADQENAAMKMDTKMLKNSLKKQIFPLGKLTKQKQQFIMVQRFNFRKLV